MTQSVKVWLDINFISTTKGAGEVLTNLENLNISPIIEKLPLANSIFWTRCNSNIDTKKDKNNSSQLNSNNEVQHDHIIVKIEIDTFIEYVNDYLSNQSSNSLIKFIDDIKQKAQVSQITLLISSLKQYLKTLQLNKTDSKAKENYDNLLKIKKVSKTTKPVLSKSEVNSVIIYLELNHQCCIRSFEGVDELRDLILSYTKSISEYASKTEVNDNLVFCDKAVEKSQTKVTKDGHGLINIWKDMIECFPMVGCDQAQAICAVYSSPLILKKAYESEKNGKMLLADIQVRRGAGVLSNVRRIGPELSQKIHKFFNSTNPNELLVNE